MTISRYTDFVRAIVDAYDQLAVAEGVEAPTIQFGRRYVEQIHGPGTAGRIVLVDATEGSAEGPLKISAGYSASVTFAIDAHIWGAEPTIADGTSEIEIELLRLDPRDTMVDRYINVVTLVAPGRSEGNSVTLNPGGASVLEHGELCVVRYSYVRGVEKQRVYDRLSITPSPRDPDRPDGSTSKTYTVSTTVEGSR